MSDSYITLRREAHDEIVIQKSRFIGYATPCASNDDAQRFIQSLKENYRDARHHCYAYIIGQNSGIMRYSDDGEPSGTAGLPMMDVIRSTGAVNCCVVVIRYFGGILLGTGGLVRAYTEASKLALKASEIVRMEMTSVFQCEVPYSVWDSLNYSIQSLPARMDSVQYGQSISFHLYVRMEDVQSVLESLQNRTGRRLSCTLLKEDYADWTI